jgi:hypothetical protein
MNTASATLKAAHTGEEIRNQVSRDNIWSCHMGSIFLRIGFVCYGHVEIGPVQLIPNEYQNSQFLCLLSARDIVILLTFMVLSSHLAAGDKV